MSEPFDSEAIANRGWRQGAILGSVLAQRASEHAPKPVDVNSTDWLILTSHDCDIVNSSIEKEPFVEVLRANALSVSKKDKRQFGGRNPRTLQFTVYGNEGPLLLSCISHDRWVVPRSLLMNESPERCLPYKERRLLAEWLAKRYIRAAFPTAFDQRWRSKLKDWQNLLKKYSERLQGVYLRLNTLNELPPGEPYKCHLILAVPYSIRATTRWAEERARIEQVIEKFWDQFKQADIQFCGVDILGTDEITLAEIEPYQRFDADWVSFEDDTETMPLAVDMPS